MCLSDGVDELTSAKRWKSGGMAAMPTLHLMVGLPGVGKTTLASSIEEQSGVLRLTPDEWMQPLFGDSEADGKRDVLEGRLIWVAHRALCGGLSVNLDFGFWSAEERYALRDIADAVPMPSIDGGAVILQPSE